MLRYIRIAVSLLFFTCLTLYFLDFAELLPSGFHHFAEVQFIPALLASHFVIVVVLLAISLLFGRIYCSSICPMGFFQDIVNRTASRFSKKRRFRYRKALTVLRWSVVAMTALAFVFGFTFLVGLLDPYSAFGRMTVHLLKPAWLAGNNLLEVIFTQFGNHTFFKVGIYIASILSLIIALISFLTIGALAWMDGRIYCNTVCPVGTVLGFFSRFALFKVRIDTSTCNSCGTCARHCKASCIDSKSHTIDYSRCINCFNCTTVCTKKAIKYKYPASKKTEYSADTVNESKRRFMISLGVVGVSAAHLLANNSLLKSKTAQRQVPISPPGSGNTTRFSEKCTSCHLCVSKCPSHVIKPSFMEYGLAGMMQPMLSFEKGFCNYDCTLCSDICPNGALLSLTQDQKHLNQMGKVQFVLENCIVHTDGTSCGACSEHCPTQAVSMKPYKDGLTIPHTNSAICVGCGGCEYVCPAKPNKAIYVEGLTAHNTITIKKEKVEEVKVDDFGF